MYLDELNNSVYPAADIRIRNATPKYNSNNFFVDTS